MSNYKRDKYQAKEFTLEGKAAKMEGYMTQLVYFYLSCFWLCDYGSMNMIAAAHLICLLENVDCPPTHSGEQEKEPLRHLR